MSISVQWGDDSKRYILVTYHGEWTWQDYQDSYTSRYELVRSVEHPVDVIVDIRLHPDPPGPDAARYIKWGWEMRPLNMRRTIMIGADSSGFMKNLVQIFVNMKGGNDNVLFVRDMDEALALIKTL